MKLDLSLPQFNAEVIVYRNNKAYKRACTKLGIDSSYDNDGVCTIITNNQKPNEYRLWLITTDNLGLIVHELSHAVTLIMEQYGLKCDEFRSYTLQNWVQETVQFMEDSK